ncbi:hypothetical protein [Sphingomonas immobilis]|uniref:Uncharacterized protein n=1 Tax=Sphingomonas immobilis TaxID=3063997 RepID=A0ABT9A2Z7_9SPHN|nr:hypothetical protein [Sphingomonas sp. CA1-15]MDO7843366.1 hypothetical protein [Sphingomonas sp. CA1-15]
MVLLMLLQAATATAAPAPAAPPATPDWAPVVKIDPATKLGSVSTSVHAADGKSRLVVRCDLPKPDIKAASVQFIPKPPFAKASPRPVTITPDDGQALGTNWEFPGGGAYIANDAVVTTLTVAIAHAKAIKVRAIGTDNVPIDATFAGPGSETVIRQVLDACGYVFGQMPVAPPPPPEKPVDPDQ